MSKEPTIEERLSLRDYHLRMILSDFADIKRTKEIACSWWKHNCDDCPLSSNDDPNEGCHNLMTFINSSSDKLNKYFSQFKLVFGDTKNEKYKTKNIIHPGEILREEFMKPMKLSMIKLAEKSKLSKKIIKDLYHENQDVNIKISEGLSKAFGTTSQFWMNLQQQYDLETLTKENIKLKKDQYKFKKKFMQNIKSFCGQFCYNCPFRRRDNRIKSCKVGLIFNRTVKEFKND